MESPQASKSSGLNLPAGMSGTSLRLDTFRGGSKLSSPSKSSSCSDRFIPCRSSSRLHTFGLIEKASPVKEGGNEAYKNMLKSELFGSDFGSPSPAGQASPMSPNKNMLRFKTDHSGPSSPFSPSILGQDSGFSSETSTPPKPPRKVPKTPHKVKISRFSWISAKRKAKTEVKFCNFSGFGCPIPTGWLLLESCGLVFAKCSCCGIRNLCLPLECLEQQSKSEVKLIFEESLQILKVMRNEYLVYVVFRWQSYVTWDLMMVSALSSGPRRAPIFQSGLMLVKFRLVSS